MRRRLDSRRPRAPLRGRSSCCTVLAATIGLRIIDERRLRWRAFICVDDHARRTWPPVPERTGHLARLVVVVEGPSLLPPERWFRVCTIAQIAHRSETDDVSHTAPSFSPRSNRPRNVAFD